MQTQEMEEEFIYNCLDGTEYSVQLQGAGMINRDYTCYLISALQLLFNAPPLVNSFAKLNSTEASENLSGAMIRCLRQSLTSSTAFEPKEMATRMQANGR